MNALARIEPAAPSRAASKVEVFMGQVLRPEDRNALRAGMPKHVPFERFERNLHNAVMNEPKLLQCSPREVFREVAKIASLGLVIDAALGEAYLIVGYSKNGPVPQIRVGYRGLIKLARQSGDVATVYAHEVCENDYIEAELGTEKRLVHRPDLFGDRGAVRGYYAAIRYKDGDTDFEPMSPAQVNAIRDRSDGYKAFKAQKIKDTPWASSYDEMAKKTCIRRLMKRSPMSPDLAAAIRIEDEADFPQQVAGQAAPATLSRRAPPEPPPEEVVEIDRSRTEPTSDPETGATDWPRELTAYRDALAGCEAAAELDEVVEAHGGIFADAPEEIRAAAAAAAADRRDAIGEDDATTPADPHADLIDRLRSAVMDGKRVAALLQALPPAERERVTEEDRKSLMAAQRNVEVQATGGSK